MAESASSKAGEDKGAELTEKLQELKDAAVEKIQDTVDESRRLVRSRPGTSMLVAFGVGAIVGVLIGRSCSSDR